MCEPTTIALTSLALTAVGTGVAAYGQYQQGQYNAQVANANASAAEAAARDAAERGDNEAAMQRLQVSRLIGRQRAAFSASGVDASSGSALDVLGDTAAMGELDVQTVRSNAAREVWGLRTQAAVDRFSGRVSRRMGAIGAGSTLLTGAGQMAGQAYGFRRSGAI